MLVNRRKAGPAFPFGQTIKSVLGYKSRKESIQTSIGIILTTPKGSIPYNPSLGSQVPFLVFDPLDDATFNLIMYFAYNDLQEQEPRLRVTSVNIEVKEPHSIVIQIGYIDRDDPDSQKQKTQIRFNQAV